MNMALKTIRELTNQFVSPREFIPDVKSKDFTRKETQAIQTNNTNSNLIDRANNFDITDLKKEKKFKYDYHHSEANRRIMDIINKRDKSPEMFRIVEKNRNLQSRETFDSNLTATLTEKCSFRESQTWTNAVASFDLELIYRCNEKKQMGWRLFRLQGSLDKYESGEEQARTRKIVEQRAKWSGTSNGIFFYGRPKRLRKCPENHTLRLKETI